MHLLHAKKTRYELERWLSRERSDGQQLLATTWHAQVAGRDLMPRPHARPVKSVIRKIKTH